MRVYLFDIDGTLADGAHRIHHIVRDDGAAKDWDTYFSLCGDDAPIPHIVGLAQDLARAGAIIVYVSGRSDVIFHETKRWLLANGLPDGPLYMRAAGDHQDDDKLKIELLAQLRADGYEPIMAFDDRNRVVRSLRAAGLPVAQVAEGDF